MDEKAVYRAAREGNTSMLRELLHENPMLLHTIPPLFTETPLHVAAMAGQAEFTKLLLSHAPSLAKQQSNRHGLNALLMAAAKGHVDVVTVFLDFNQELDLISDTQGFAPLHYAAYYGRVDVAKLLVSRNFSLLKQINLKGETALHVAVKTKRYEVLRNLEEMLKNVGAEFYDDVMRHTKDVYGNTVAQLLVASTSQLTDGTLQTKCINLDQTCDEANNNNNHGNSENEIPDGKETFYRESILLVMGLIATVTFQALINPPSSFFEDGMAIQSKRAAFIIFMVDNTAAFLISCWGLLAAILRSDILMPFYWLASALIFIQLSYLEVILSLVEKGNRAWFFGRIFLALLIQLTASIVLYSRTWKKIYTKIKECAKGSSTSANTDTRTATSSA